jgi:hypothetical protein
MVKIFGLKSDGRYEWAIGAFDAGIQIQILGLKSHGRSQWTFDAGI